MKTNYVIDPLDTLLFRDARPFSEGENSVGQSSLFPPAPHTVVGAIRAQWAVAEGWLGRGMWDRHQKGLLEKLGGDQQQLQGLHFCGPELVSLSKAEPQCLYPAPAALLGCLNNKQRVNGAPPPTQIVRLKPSANNFQTDLGQVCIPVADVAEGDKVEDRKNLQGCYLTATGLHSFLHGQVPSQAEHWYQQSYVFQHEARVGNQIDTTTGKVKDGMLYSTQHIRFADDIRLLMQLDSGNAAHSKPQHLALGGEGRAASVSFDHSLAPVVPLNAGDFSNASYLVYVRTPILLPEEGVASPLPKSGETFLNLPGKVVSACLYPALRYGEWIQEAGLRQSKTRSAIAPGSVVFMQAENAQQLDELLAIKHIGERSSWGYGRIALGNW